MKWNETKETVNVARCWDPFWSEYGRFMSVMATVTNMIVVATIILGKYSFIMPVYVVLFLQ